MWGCRRGPWRPTSRVVPKDTAKGLSWDVTEKRGGKDDVLGHAKPQEKDDLPQTCSSDAKLPVMPTGSPVSSCPVLHGAGGLSWAGVLLSRPQLCWEAAATPDTAKASQVTTDAWGREGNPCKDTSRPGIWEYTHFSSSPAGKEPLSFLKSFTWQKKQLSP